MKYTFELDGKQKTIDIDDAWLRNQKQNLGLSTKEAIRLWLFDHDFEKNEEADALTAKAKKANAGLRATGGERKKPVRKPDDVKRSVIQGLFEYISTYAEVRDPQVANPERVIAFSLGDENYEITLTKKRKAK